MPTPTTSPSRGAILMPSTFAAAAVVKVLEASVDVPPCETAVAVTRYCVPGTNVPLLSHECNVGSSEPITVSPSESATDTAVSVPSATETDTCEPRATDVAPSDGATVSCAGGEIDGAAEAAGALLVGAPATSEGAGPRVSMATARSQAARDDSARTPTTPAMTVFRPFRELNPCLLDRSGASWGHLLVLVRCSTLTRAGNF